LASGQAFATEYYSTVSIGDGDLTNGAKWEPDAPMGVCGAGSAGAGIIAMVAADMVIVCPGHSLNLTTAATLNAGTLAFDGTPPGGAWGGSELKFSAGNKRIVNSTTAAITINRLNLSAMTSGNTISINAMGRPVIFSDVTGGALECPNGSGTAYIPSDPIPANTTCGVLVVPGGGGGGAVSAPIFSTKEKPAVFSEEVK